MKIDLKIWSCVLLVLLCVSLPAAEIPQPDQNDLSDVKRFYGDQRCVELLGGLCADPDELIRESAVFGLGQCDNFSALDIIEKASDDKSPAVRAAAVQAAGNYNTPKARSIVIKGLKDRDPMVFNQTLTVIRSKNIRSAGDVLKAMIELNDSTIKPPLKLSIVQTLNRLGQPVSADQLLKLLDSSVASIKVRACENILLLNKPSVELLEKLKQLAYDDNAAVAAAAVRCLAEFDHVGSSKIFESSLKHPSPLVRASAYDGLFKLKRVNLVKAALSDQSVIVRLVGIRYSGKYKLDKYSPQLFKIMLNAGFEDWHQPTRQGKLPANIQNDPHIQARNALSLIATQQVIKLAGDYVKNTQLPKDTKTLRDLTSCMWILGELKSSYAIDAMLSHAGKIPVYEQYLEWIATAIGNVGNPQAVETLKIVLANSRKQAARHLADRASGSMNIAPFSQSNTAAVIKALVALGHNDTKAYIDIASMSVGSRMGKQVLNELAGEIIEFLPTCTPQADMSMLQEWVCNVIIGESYLLQTKNLAAFQSGRMKIKKAVDPLTKMLSEDVKKTRCSIKCAGWALQQITGKTPALPQPTVSQGNWIIRKAQ